MKEIKIIMKDKREFGGFLETEEEGEFLLTKLIYCDSTFVRVDVMFMSGEGFKKNTIAIRSSDVENITICDIEDK